MDVFTLAASFAVISGIAYGIRYSWIFSKSLFDKISSFINTQKSLKALLPDVEKLKVDIEKISQTSSSHLSSIDKLENKITSSLIDRKKLIHNNSIEVQIYDIEKDN